MYDIRKMQEQALFNAVKAAGGAQVAETVVYGGGDNCEDDAAWVGASMGRLESRFGADEVKRIRMKCQCGYGMGEKLALVKGLMAAASSLEEFAGQPEARAAGLYCEAGELYLEFRFCPCPMLARVDALDSYAWCQCSAGYSKALFEEAFGCEVDVRLLRSIKAGDSVCLMKIVPEAPVFGT